METLVLSSMGIGIRPVREDLLRLVPLFSERLEVALIPTASRGLGMKRDHAEMDRKSLEEMRYGVQEIDIARMNSRDLERALRDKHMVYVSGGNSFYLLAEARASGFIDIVPQLAREGIPYFGVSAGAYLACPTIEAHTWGGAPVEIRHGVTDFTALGLVPYLIKAHFNRERARDGLYEGIEQAKQREIRTRLLTDSQAFLVINGHTQLIGKGQEETT